MDFTGASKYTPKATELFKKGVVYSGIEGMTIQKGIDDTKDLRYLSSDLTIKSDYCNISRDNNGVLTEKKISVYPLTTGTKYCKNDWQGYATPNDFLSQINAQEIEDARQKIMQLTWTGIKTGGTDKMDGLLYWANEHATITAEELTMTALGTAYELEHDRLYESTAVIVTSDPAGTTYDVDDDYTVDYLAGTITGVTGGAISAGDDLLVTYVYAIGATSLNYSTTLSDTTIDDAIKLFTDVRATNLSMVKRGVAEIYCSPQIYQYYLNNRLASNFYNDSLKDLKENEMWVYGFKGIVKLVMVPELVGVDDMYMTWRRNFVIGLDEQGESGVHSSERVITYSIETKQVYMDSFTKRGTRILFEDEIYKLR